MVKAKPVIKAAAIDKTINASTDSLTKACNDAVTAITKKTAEAKNLMAEVKRHTKKKAILTRRSKTAATKLKKDPNAANKKAVTDVAKEIKLTSSALDKARTNKAFVSTELAALRAASKRLNAYTKAIAAADKVLNKPVIKKRKRKVVK